MNPELLRYLACPACGSDLDADFPPEREVTSGALSCVGCSRRFRSCAAFRA